MIWRKLLLLVAALAVVVQTNAGFCGDGVPDYTVEQCDSGMRALVVNQTLAWNGIGPALPSKFVSVIFRYAVADYNGSAVAQDAYAVQIQYGSTRQSPLAYGYSLVCTDGATTVLQLLPSGANPETKTFAAMVSWTFNGSLTNCSRIMTVEPGTINAELAAAFVALEMTWTGSITTDTWFLQTTIFSAAAFGPNTASGTDCCTSACKRTWATVYYDRCDLSGAPSWAQAAGYNYRCQRTGLCTDEPAPVAQNSPTGCGDGILDPGEQCDPGLAKVSTSPIGFVATSCPFPMGGTYQPQFLFWFYVHGIHQYIAGTNMFGGGGSLPESWPLRENWVSSYFFNCSTDMFAGTITFSIYPNVTDVYPWVNASWTYALGNPSTTCADYDINPVTTFMLFQSAVSTFHGGSPWFQECTTTSGFSGAGMDPTTADTTCCTSACTIPSTPFPTSCSEVPALVPLPPPIYNNPYGWSCNNTLGAGICSDIDLSSPTPSATALPTVSSTATQTGTPTITRSGTRTGTSTRTTAPSQSTTKTVSASPSMPASVSVGASASITRSPAASASITASPSRSPSLTISLSGTVAPSPTASVSTGASASQTPSNSGTGTATQTRSPSQTNSQTPSASTGASPSGTPTSSPAPASETPSPQPFVYPSASAQPVAPWVVAGIMGNYAVLATTAALLLAAVLIMSSSMQASAAGQTLPVAAQIGIGWRPNE